MNSEKIKDDGKERREMGGERRRVYLSNALTRLRQRSRTARYVPDTWHTRMMHTANKVLTKYQLINHAVSQFSLSCQ